MGKVEEKKVNKVVPFSGRSNKGKGKRRER
jgi:hypothetical protein